MLAIGRALMSGARFVLLDEPSMGLSPLLMQELFRVLEDAFDMVYNLGQRTAVERLAVFLLYMRYWTRLSERIADNSDPILNSVQLPMSREDIADFLGLKKETVSRSFRQLEERGLISRRERSGVQIEALDALRELAGISDFASPRHLGRIR